MTLHISAKNAPMAIIQPTVAAPAPNCPRTASLSTPLYPARNAPPITNCTPKMASSCANTQSTTAKSTIPTATVSNVCPVSSYSKTHAAVCVVSHSRTSNALLALGATL